MKAKLLFILLIGIALCSTFSESFARNPYRRAFFNVYTSANGSRLDDLASNAGHCGACHLDFDGAGPRNAYGLDVEVALNSNAFSSTEDAILSLESDDSDNDGFSNLVEITDLLNFSNTPTFPGLTETTASNALNVDLTDLQGFLTPSGGTDTDPPLVTVTWPNGGEAVDPETIPVITWTAADASGISHVDIYMSDDGGLTYKMIAKGETDDGMYEWFVPNLPGPLTRIQVAARDNAGNYGFDSSDADFSLNNLTRGRVPTTLRDVQLPGSQPFFGGEFEDPDANCATCHGNYDTAVEPWSMWKGSMMAQAMRDPLYLATLIVAEQDAPSVGDMCIRCHSPGGWLEGRSTDTDGGLLNATDKQGVQCDFCHRAVDPVYKEGISPPEDAAILANLDDVPDGVANGAFVADPSPIRRGPYDDAIASHQVMDSALHRSSDMCGYCHDVSNPVFVSGGSDGLYVVDALDSEHPDKDLRNMMPVERTFSEWTQSEYASTGVYAPQFAGSKADGIVSTCQDCHMRDTVGVGSSEPGSPTRNDLPMHDLTGGNYFIPDILPDFVEVGEVDVARLQAGKARAIAMLQKAASINLSAHQEEAQLYVEVEVINETGHKLPSGYPEGRRVWINLKAYDAGRNLIYESGAYDESTGVLTHDHDAKIYQIEGGISSRLGPAIGMPVGFSFHFALNDTIYMDNRIPPRGFTNANFTAIQSPVVGYVYEDGDYSDETQYPVPAETKFVEATVYYQTTSKEYIEFLRDENVTNSLGQELYDAWVGQGRAAPITMVADTLSVAFDPTDVDISTLPKKTSLAQNHPNPFNPSTEIEFYLQREGYASLRVYDLSGRFVRTLEEGVLKAGSYTSQWDGKDHQNKEAASGVYFARLNSDAGEKSIRMVLLK